MNVCPRCPAEDEQTRDAERDGHESQLEEEFRRKVGVAVEATVDVEEVVANIEGVLREMWDVSLERGRLDAAERDGRQW